MIFVETPELEGCSAGVSEQLSESLELLAAILLSWGSSHWRMESTEGENRGDMQRIRPISGDSVWALDQALPEVCLCIIQVFFGQRTTFLFNFSLIGLVIHNHKFLINTEKKIPCYFIYFKNLHYFKYMQ